MTNLISFLSEADSAALRLEGARRELETAKLNLEQAKLAYDSVVAKADELGIPRAKLKRLTDERLASLIDTGLAGLPASQSSAPRAVDTKADRPKKTSKAKIQNGKSDLDTDLDTAVETLSESEIDHASMPHSTARSMAISTSDDEDSEMDGIVTEMNQ